MAMTSSHRFPGIFLGAITSRTPGENISAPPPGRALTPDFISLSKLAIQYSDGVIIANENVNPALKEHIATTGKPWLPFNGLENYIDEYADFYEKILAQPGN